MTLVDLFFLDGNIPLPVVDSAYVTTCAPPFLLKNSEAVCAVAQDHLTGGGGGGRLVAISVSLFYRNLTAN